VRLDTVIHAPGENAEVIVAYLMRRGFVRADDSLIEAEAGVSA
jgi:hypothetical protein